MKIRIVFVIGLAIGILSNLGTTKIQQRIAKEKLATVCEASKYGEPCQNLMNDYAMKYDGEVR